MKIKVAPKEGKGKRDIYCPFDGECVDYAAKMSWRAFHCEKCEMFGKNFALNGGIEGVEGPASLELRRGEGEKMEEEIKTKACKKCGVPKPLDDFKRHSKCPDGHVSVCNACHESIRPDRKGKVLIPTGPDEDRLNLDFSGQKKVFTMLKDRAEIELRTIEAQAIYMIRDAFGKEGIDEIYDEEQAS